MHQGRIPALRAKGDRKSGRAIHVLSTGQTTGVTALPQGGEGGWATTPIFYRAGWGRMGDHICRGGAPPQKVSEEGKTDFPYIYIYIYKR